MPRTGLITIDTSRLEGVTRKLPLADRRIQDKVNRTMRLLDAAAEGVFKEAAPFDTGDLRKGLKSSIVFRGKVVRITVRATAVRDGFDYLTITRFGHQASVIVPRRRKFMKVHAEGRGSAPVLRRSVRGYHPAKDWVDEAGREVSLLARSASRALARDIQTTVIR